MTLRLLLVDDSTHFLEAARMLLEREGMRVIAVASTGAEAVQRARELQPDVTLVDIDLGEESGFDVARRLTQATGALAGHVVLISAHSEDDLREFIDTSHSVGFLPKSRLSGQAIRQLIGAGGAEGGVCGGRGT